MMQVDVLNLNNKKIDSVNLPEEIVNCEIDESILHQVVRWQLASKRQGTHMTKTKGLVSGGGKKPFKQKGTGNARQGSTRSPLMPGGGTVFGPQPRDYSYSLPKKVRKIGLKMALANLFKNNKVTVVDALKVSGKTKELAQSLRLLGKDRAVISDLELSENLVRAGRNLDQFVLIPVVGVNVYDLLKYDALICTKESLHGLFRKAGV